ncbi:MAG: hypothetical protein RL660_2446 [Bacteroidota bacterium]
MISRCLLIILILVSKLLVSNLTCNAQANTTIQIATPAELPKHFELTFEQKVNILHDPLLVYVINMHLNRLQHIDTTTWQNLLRSDHAIQLSLEAIDTSKMFQSFFEYSGHSSRDSFYIFEKLVNTIMDSLIRKHNLLSYPKLELINLLQEFDPSLYLHSSSENSICDNGLFINVVNEIASLIVLTHAASKLMTRQVVYENIISSLYSVSMQQCAKQIHYYLACTGNPNSGFCCFFHSRQLQTLRKYSSLR